jgi:type II secretory pathway pseudopilin PulG
MGQDMARCGLASMALVVFLIAAFIGITVPERLRQRELGLRAGVEAQGYTLQRAFLEYRARYKTYPTTMKDLQDGLPDRDGSIAIALSNIDPNSYKPSANLADASTAKPDRLRGVAIRRVSTNSSTDDSVNERFSFTNYEVRLPGEDKTPNTDDDWLMRDGVFVRPTRSGQASPNSTSVETTP